MKKFFLLLVFFLFSSTSLLAEYRLEPGNCTLKKKSNCGAYLYNSNTGATYFCNTEKCKEIMPALEETSESIGSEETKKSKIPKMKKKKKSKIPKFKKKKSE